MNPLHTLAYSAGCCVRCLRDNSWRIWGLLFDRIIEATEMLKPPDMDYLPWDARKNPAMNKAEWDKMLRTRGRKSAVRSNNQTNFARYMKGK